MNQIFGNKTTKTSQGPVASPSGIPSFGERPLASEIANYSAIPYYLVPIWPDDSEVDIAVYVSPQNPIASLDRVPSASKVVDEHRFKIGDYKDKREIHTSIDLPREVQEKWNIMGSLLRCLKWPSNGPRRSRL